ncbi:type IV secretory system conjugative DNA transfer family protein [Kiloniella sp.]|uniref:type IV secretory system conjugative DNA transfer family protein n=1 Tax=Kiloniella sp. TaxID=1938587 RepID=UPI003B02E9CE
MIRSTGQGGCRNRPRLLSLNKSPEMLALLEKMTLLKIKIPTLLLLIYVLSMFPIGFSFLAGLKFNPPMMITIYLLMCILSFVTRYKGYRQISDYIGIPCGTAAIIMIISAFKKHFGVPVPDNLIYAFERGGLYYQVLVPAGVFGIPISVVAIVTSLRKKDTLSLIAALIAGLFFITFLIESTTSPITAFTFVTYPYAVTCFISAIIMFALSWNGGTKKQTAWMRYIATGFALTSVGLFVYLFGYLAWLAAKTWWSILTPDFAFIKAGVETEKFFVRVWLFMGGHIIAGAILSMIAWFVPMAYYRKHWLTDPWKIITNKSTTSKAGHWQGRFMETEKVNQLVKNREGLPLGLDDRNNIARYLPNRDDGWLKGHHTVIAASQGGKGVAAIIPAMLDHSGPLFTIDLKGELFMMTRAHRERMGKKVVVLNPFKMHGEPTDTYNPFDFIRPDFVEEDIAIIVDGMIMNGESDEPTSPHFQSLAVKYLSVAIEVAYLSGNEDQKNLISIAKAPSSPDFDKVLTYWANDADLCNGRAQAIGSEIIRMGDDERGSFGTSLGNNTKWLLSDKVSKAFSKSNFSFDDLLDGNTDIFIAIPSGLLETHARIPRLLTNIFISTVTRHKLPKQEILGIFDEFCRLGKMNKIIDISTLLVGYKLTVLFVAQDFGQIVGIYKESGATTILSNCATVRIYALGRMDTITSEYMEKCLTDMTVLSQTERNSDTNDSANETRTKLLTAAEITELPFNQIICFIRSNRPLLLKTIFSPTHPRYKNNIGQSPLH